YHAEVSTNVTWVSRLTIKEFIHSFARVLGGAGFHLAPGLADSREDFLAGARRLWFRAAFCFQRQPDFRPFGKFRRNVRMERSVSINRVELSGHGVAPFDFVHSTAGGDSVPCWAAVLRTQARSPRRHR